MNVRLEHMRRARVLAMLQHADRYNDEERAWLEAHKYLVEAEAAAPPKPKKAPRKKKGS